MLIVTFLCLAAGFSGAYTKKKYNLNGKIAIVTGGAKGIGFAIVDNFLKGGAKTVYIIDINKPRGMQAERELNFKYGPKKVVFICADVTKDLDRMTEIMRKSGVKVDILVNNAGIADENDVKKTILTNALAPMLWSRKYIEHMRKDKGHKGGTIIIISSISGYMRDPFYPIYKTTKYALLGFTFCMGHEYNFLTTGVRIFAICPGPTDTDLFKQTMVPEEQEEVFQKFLNEKAQDPDAVGQAAAVLYETAETGTAYTVQGGEPPFVSPDRVDLTVDMLLSE